MAAGFSILFDDAPDETLGNAASVEVHECIGEPTSFRLHYALDITEGDLPLLKESALSAGAKISVVAPTDDGLVCVVKGTVRGQQFHLEHGGEGSVLDVLGADSTLAMDREDKASLWSDLTDSDAVNAIVAQYGFTPDVEDTAAGHFEAKHVLVQRETDLAFVRRLAARNGFLFWVTYDAASKVETAHFKRPPIDDDPAVELVINLDDPPANVGALDVNWDAEAPASASAVQVDLNTRDSLDGSAESSPLTALAAQRFSEIGTTPRTLHLAVPVDDSGDLRSRSEGALIEAELFIRARGQTTAHALGKVLRAHTIVSLRGAGARHSGKWLCQSVKHELNAVEHRMEFELVRNGWEE
jgi:Phage tail baseplate hub (GPD)